jgi:hypothetical protein
VIRTGRGAVTGNPSSAGTLTWAIASDTTTDTSLLRGATGCVAVSGAALDNEAGVSGRRGESGRLMNIGTAKKIVDTRAAPDIRSRSHL